jgi:GNAT superfamily N-acetyltransferase
VPRDPESRDSVLRAPPLHPRANIALIGLGGSGHSGPVTQTTRLVVRPATAADMPEAHAVVREGLSSARDPAALEFYRTSPGGQLTVACYGSRVVGVSYAASFGRTGWIGNVAVHPEARGRGIGTAVSQAALDALRRAGAVTVLLTATQLGRPIYEKLGFGYDGLHYGMWRRDEEAAAGGRTDGSAAGVAAVDGVAADGVAGRSAAGGQDAPGAAGDAVADGAVITGGIEDVTGLDAAATGEDRRRFLVPFAARARVTRDGTGYRVPLPWGRGPVIASSADSAHALLADLVAADPEPFLAFPETNATGADVATSLGLRQVKNIPRMRFGPPVPGFRPERVFNVFSFAVG